MTLNFPNQSRSYDEARGCVSFWGHESAFEVTFQVDESALRRISPDAQQDEASLLRTFDGNRVRIQKVAGAAFSRQRKSYYRLSAADF